MITFKTESDRQELLNALDLDMNEEFRATLQYIAHRIIAKAEHQVLAEAFKSAALDEMSHILFFSDLITKYGGTPHLVQWDIDKSTAIKEMLQQDILLEKAARERYAAQLERFKDYPEICSIVSSVLADEQDHEDEFSRYLNGQS
jgi:bacterioferritin (cytochrome b1)